MALPKTPSKDHGRIIKTVGEYRREAEEARNSRMLRTRQNWDIYFGNQDWSYKQEGQSTEFLPKLGAAVEQFSAFAKKALVQFGSWYSIDAPRDSLLTGDQMRAFLDAFISNVPTERNRTQHIGVIIGNSIKMGLLESLIILKVHGYKVDAPHFYAEAGREASGYKLKSKKNTVWRLRTDIIPSDEYYPDPTGRCLYEIHRVERDLIDVQALAEAGIYDANAIDEITEDYKRTDRQKRRESTRNQNETTKPSFRKSCVIDECWGVLLNEDGGVIQENCVTTILNEKKVIREPQKNPFWHGESPFVAAPLVQIPGSVWSKALYDDAAQLNIALNEMYNLILDGGLAEVWGVRQVRADWLEDPRQVSGGIPQNATLAIKADVPINGKVVETVSQGSVPPSALAVYSLTDREFQAATWSSDLKMGFLPPRAVKATEVVQAEQGSSQVMDSLVGDVEHEVIERVLRKGFLTILQFSDELPADEVIEALGPSLAYSLWRLTPAQRYAMFANGSKFKVFGLSATLNRVREFQKIMAMMQAVMTNPLLMQAFMEKYSADKTLATMLKSLNINPETMFMDEEEKAKMPERIAAMPAMAQLMGGGPPGGEQQSAMGGPSAAGVGGASMAGQINQEGAQSSGV